MNPFLKRAIRCNSHKFALSGRMINRGLTLVELLVAMILSLLVIGAAVMALLAGRRGAETVDIAGQLRDNGRFASELIQRLVVQTGFEDIRYAASPRAVDKAGYYALSGVDITSFRPNLQGYNNAVPSSTDPLNGARAGGGSDVLILQYQSVKGNPFALDGGANSSDGSMIDCAGSAPSTSAAKRYDRIVSVLYVATDNQGEPSLMCMTRNDSGIFSATPLIRGVESFQVLYGVDNVEANTAPTGDVSTVPNQYLRADQLQVTNLSTEQENENATNTNWRRVRSVRVGLVLRGSEGSAQNAENRIYFPLGGENYSNVDDVGSRLAVNDNRLRHVVTFTVLLRNCQSQGYQPMPNDPTNRIPCNVVLPSLS